MEILKCHEVSDEGVDPALYVDSIIMMLPNLFRILKNHFRKKIGMMWQNGCLFYYYANDDN